MASSAFCFGVLPRQAVQDMLQAGEGLSGAAPPVLDQLCCHAHSDLRRCLASDVQPDGCVDRRQAFPGDPFLEQGFEGGPDPAATPDHPDVGRLDGLLENLAKALRVLPVSPGHQNHVAPPVDGHPGEGILEIHSDEFPGFGESFPGGKLGPVVQHSHVQTQIGPQGA